MIWQCVSSDFHVFFCRFRLLVIKTLLWLFFCRFRLLIQRSHTQKESTGNFYEVPRRPKVDCISKKDYSFQLCVMIWSWILTVLSWSWLYLLSLAHSRCIIYLYLICILLLLHYYLLSFIPLNFASWLWYIQRTIIINIWIFISIIVYCDIFRELYDLKLLYIFSPYFFDQVRSIFSLVSPNRLKDFPWYILNFFNMFFRDINGLLKKLELIGGALEIKWSHYRASFVPPKMPKDLAFWN